MFWIAMIAVLLNNSAYASVISEVESNDTLLTAQHINSFNDSSLNPTLYPIFQSDFSSDFSVNIGDEKGVNNSLVTTHVTIEGTGDGSSYDYYAFTMPFTIEGDRLYFDIDFGHNIGGSDDLEIAIWDSAFNLLAENDDFDTNAGDEGSVSNFDPFIGPYLLEGNNFNSFNPNLDLNYLFYVGVAGFDAIAENGGWSSSSAFIDLDADYTLQIAMQSLPVPASFWLMGSAILGIFGISRKKKTI